MNEASKERTEIQFRKVVPRAPRAVVVTLRVGDEFCVGGVVYRVTYINIAKQRATIEPVKGGVRAPNGQVYREQQVVEPQPE